MTTGTGEVVAGMDLATIDVAGIDPQDMLGTVEASPEQWRHALELADAAPTPPGGPPAAVVVAGMGGSGISGDVAALLAARGSAVPVVATKGYELPAFVGPDTLFVAVSYSGNTEETLACLDQALAAGARCFAVTSGGAVTERAASAGFPVAQVPGGRQPRASLAYVTVPVLVALERVGVLTGVRAELERVPAHLEALVGTWGRTSSDNEPWQVAQRLRGLVPVLYGGQGVPAAVALRGKCQVNENAKRPAFHHELPEQNHNEIVGWTHAGASAGSDGPAGAAAFGLLVLRSPDEHPQVSRRIDATLDLVGDGFGLVHQHRVAGDTVLTRLAAGVLFVDLLSVHLALLDGTDPTPVVAIEQLKRRIRTDEIEERDRT